MLYFLGGDFDLAVFLSFVLIAILAFAYHEFGHAIVADYLGDMTPRSLGRITLNPFPHLSLVGLIMLIIIGFGWAVTPINPNQMRGNPRTSRAIVSIAGPAMNLLMAILFALPLRFLFTNFAFLQRLTEMGLSGFIIEDLRTLLVIGVNLNLFLIAFNLLPIPPLDGFWVLRGLVPLEMAYQMDRLQQYGMLIFLLIIFILPNIGINIFPLINSFTSFGFSLLVGV